MSIRVRALAVSVLLSVGVLPPVLAPAASAAITGSSIRGMNWADSRDNCVCGNLVLSGLWDGESYDTVYSKASAIERGFAAQGANTVRLPVNVVTVTGTAWNAYTGAIDAAVAQGMNVILSEWDACDSADGKLDPGWEGMWDAVIAKYGSNDRVLFEIMNEPYGYSASEWLNTAAGWLNRYPALPRGRVIVSGPGYNNDAYTAGRDPRFNGTLLSVHDYAFWQGALNYQQWRDQIAEKVDVFADRTVFTEFGTFMQTGLNFNNTGDTRNEVAYLRGITDQMNAMGVGAVYWPGARSGDNYALNIISGAAQNGSGSSVTLALQNQSGLDRLRTAWRLNPQSVNGGASYSLTNRESGLVLDVVSASTTAGAQVNQWTNTGGSNQRWTFGTAATSGYYTLVNVNSGQCLDVPGSSRTSGTQLTQWPCNGGANQQWTQLRQDSTHYLLKNLNSGLCADVNQASRQAGATVIQYPCNTGSYNQQWSN